MMEYYSFLKLCKDVFVLKRFISLLLALTLVFGFEVVSAMESEIVKLPNALSGLFSLEAAALEASIASHAPSGTFDVALDASVTASSSYESGVSWGVDFINNGRLVNVVRRLDNRQHTYGMVGVRP